MTEKTLKELARKGVTLKLAAILVPLTVLFAATLVMGFYTIVKLKGDAKNINYAGNLRYRSYKLALQVNEYPVPQGGARDSAHMAILGSMEDLETILYGLRDGNKALGLKGFKLPPGIEEGVFSYTDPWWQFDRHIKDYNERVKPLILHILNFTNREEAVEALKLYNKNVHDFVTDADRTVHLLQSLSEKKLSWFKNTEFILLGLFLGIIGASFSLSVFFIRRPLLGILKGAEAFRSGDLDYRVPVRGRDEMGALARGFNTMAETIKKDVETIKAQTKEVQESRDFLNDVLGNIGCLVRVINPKTHKVLLQNNSLQAIFSQGMERPCYTFWGRETECDLCVSSKAIEESRHCSKEVETPEGIVYEVHSFPLPNPDGSITTAIEVIRDITARKKDESKMRLLESQKMVAVGHLSNGIAHHINNPLSGIDMCTEILLKKMEEKAEKLKEASMYGELKNHLRRIKESSGRCESVVKDLLSISRVTNPEKSPNVLNKLIERILNKMANQLETSGARLIKELSNTAPAVLSNYAQLEVAFVNLISNAIDVVPKGGTLTVKTEHLADKNKVEVTINDTGPAINKKDLPHLFDPYFILRIRPSTRCTGLELALSQLAIQSHGGTVEVDSEEGRGTTFKVELPVYHETVELPVGSRG